MAVKCATYQEYDEYVIDYNTTNASFIAMASILYRKGIENYNFFLKLYDEDLIGIDPHDPDLDFATKTKIIIECKRNFWYFAREVMIIPGTGRFELNRANLAAAWALLNNIPIYLILPRQHGKTWLVITFALWVFNFGSNYTNMLFANKQLKDSQANLKRLKDARELLPDYLQMKLMDNGKGEMREARSNVNSAVNGLHNEITVTSSARNPLAADELGRGMTVAWIWVDEFAFVQFMRIIYAAMMPAWSKASEIAKKKGKPYAKIFTTTPGDLATDHGDFAYDVLQNSAVFFEGLYDYEPDKFAEWFKKNSKYGYLFIQFMYYQLNHADPDAWFDEQCKDMAYNYPKIRREILLQWNSASSNSPFAEEDIKDLRSMLINESESNSIIINKYYKLNVYRKINPEDKYIICVDPAKGRGENADRTAIVITDAKTHNIHAIFKSNTIQYKETFRFLHTLVYEYVPNCVLVVENNIDTLIEYIKGSSLKHLLYYEFNKNTVKEKRTGIKNKKSSNDLIVYGINTSAQNRPKYFDLLFEYVRNYKERICCREMIEEIERLEYKSETRIEAIHGQHDDVVLAYLIGEYVLTAGNNRPRFGLFYADDFGTEYKKTDNSVFRSTMFRPENNMKPRYENPFWNELLKPYETIEDLDRRWKKKHSGSGKREVYQTNVFTGDAEISGLETIRVGAFDELNDSGVYDRLNATDQFGYGSYNSREQQELDFMNDLNNDFF